MKAVVNTASACFPGWALLDSVRACLTGSLEEPMLGQLSTSHIQLCPQSRGLITESVCDVLQETYPDTQFRLHANAHVLASGRVAWDASDFNASTLPYFKRLAAISKRLNAPAYSLHAGNKECASLQAMLDNLNRIQDLFGDIPVAVEGLYPSKRKSQRMDTWDEYQAVYDSGAFVALDLSHLNLLPQHESRSAQWMAWLNNPQTLEIHLSGNEGLFDSHALLDSKPFWWDGFCESDFSANTVIFSEGNQLRQAMAA